MKYSELPSADAEVFDILQGEGRREMEGLELIPSENYVSPAVLEALGTLMTNKYSEGTPGRRYYGGQTYTDRIESLAIERAKALFGADHANVQPLSGAAANLCAYTAWMEPGDTALAMDKPRRPSHPRRAGDLRGESLQFRALQNEGRGDRGN